MGDLLFKLKKDSPVLLNTPDVTFHEVPRDLKVILLMSSDGLWNYLPEDKLNRVSAQNKFVFNKVGYEYDVGTPLSAIATRLCFRDFREVSQFDDCICLLFCFETLDLERKFC
jgi:serine/threonine protein phosphatase PrpC